MKTLIAILLLLAMIGGGAYYAKVNLSPHDAEVVMENLYSLGELALYQYPSNGESTNAVDSWLNTNLGHCEVTLAISEENSKNPVYVYKELRALYSNPVTLSKNGYVCAFPGQEKSFLINPVKSANVVVRRFLNRPASISVLSGKLTITSEKLALRLDFPWATVTLTSIDPSRINIAVRDDDVNISINMGKLSLAYEVKTSVGNKISASPMEIKPILFDLGKDAGFEYMGKPVMKSGQGVLLYPGGLQAPTAAATPATPPGASTAPAAPATPATPAKK